MNIEGSSITTATDLSYAATALAVVALVAALLVLRRRPLAVPAPPPAPQV